MSNYNFAILMATFNGDKFLKEQLDSIFDQNYENFKLFISDDGSTDQTKIILNLYKNKYKNKIKIFNGPKLGFANNFRYLLKKVPNNFDYYFFCDQDDLWIKNRLSYTNKIFLKRKEIDLLISKAYLINSTKDIIGETKFYKFKPTFQHALFQNYSPGNSMVISNFIKKKIVKYDSVTLPAHDWLVYIFTSSINGHIYLLNKKLIYYRQHRNSLIGYNLTIISRIINYFSKTFKYSKKWTVLHVNYLKNVNEIKGKNKDFLIRLNELIVQKKRFRLSLYIFRNIIRENFLSKLLYCIIFIFT